MAATSQAHDEARHFYVMHDYLQLALGDVPRAIHPRQRSASSPSSLETDDLACKLMGMQLQVETTALTVFQHAREARVCPVLADLLLYFEKDEARHVGLGTQCLPILMRRMNRRRRRPPHRVRPRGHVPPHRREPRHGARAPRPRPRPPPRPHAGEVQADDRPGGALAGHPQGRHAPAPSSSAT